MAEREDPDKVVRVADEIVERDLSNDVESQQGLQEAISAVLSQSDPERT